MQKSIVLFANPKARSGLGARSVRAAQRNLWGWDLKVIQPTSLEAYHHELRSLDPATTEGVILVGGDGTFHQALPTLLEKKIPAIPYPAGTANDLAWELGITENWELIQNLIDQKKTENIDLISANGIPFATVAGVGVGSRITHEFNGYRDRYAWFRKLSQALNSEMYQAIALKNFLFHSDYVHHLDVRTPHFNERVKSAAMFICNQATLGAEMKVAPRLSQDDKRFNVLIIPRVRAFSLARALMSLKAGKSSSDFIQFSTDSLKIRDVSGKSISVFGDGESLVSAQEVEFKVMPKALTVYRNKGGILQ